MRTLKDIQSIGAYVITKGELEYVIEIFQELRILSDSSEYLEEEAEEAIEILRSLIIEDINVDEQEMNVQEVSENEAISEDTTAAEEGKVIAEYAAKIFGMLNADDDYSISEEILIYIKENPVADEDQVLVTLALNSLVEQARANSPEACDPVVVEKAFEEEAEDA